MPKLNVNGGRARARRRARHAAALGAARAARPDRHQVRLRRRAVRRLHRAHRRRADAQLRAAGVGGAAGEKIVTIEGLSRDGSHPLQKAWVALDVPQCGYCQSGMIMAAAALLKTKPKPTDADIDEAMTNICRCGTYNRVRAAIKRRRAGGDTQRARRSRSSTSSGGRHERRTAIAISRRPFLGTSAAAAGALVVGFHIPFAGAARRRAPRRRRSTPGSSCSPTTRVVIRIARSEMGQGTLTGLAQLVAEELECDWAKVTTEYPTPGAEPRAQSRLGQFLHRRQPRHPRVARVRAQGRRGGAHDARAGGGRRVEGAGRPNARSTRA